MKYSILLLGASLFIAGCTYYTPEVQEEPVQTPPQAEGPVKQTVPPPPKKDIKLKEVQDNNFTAEYMYPKAKTKEKPQTVLAENNMTTPKKVNGMSKEECIQMIGEEKFNKYAQMFGSEDSSIKRCAMLKRTQYN